MPAKKPIDAKQLAQIPIFRGLKASEAESLVSIAQEVTAKGGEWLFKEGDPGEALYILLEGTVEVVKKDRAGVQQPLAKLAEGTALGEMSLVRADATRSASAIAATPVRLLKISTDRFSTLLGQDNLGALKVVHNLAQLMSRRLSLMDEKLIELLDKGKRKEELVDFQKILANWAF